jgi:hypothetical protein
MDNDMSTEYYIEVSYKTGNSFGSKDTTDEVGMVWYDLNQAKKALMCIKEHYEFYNSCHGWGLTATEVRKAKDKACKSDWYSKDYPEGCLYVEKDDGCLQQISAFWTGYFETLYGAEIKSRQDSDMSFKIGCL